MSCGTRKKTIIPLHTLLLNDQTLNACLRPYVYQ